MVRFPILLALAAAGGLAPMPALAADSAVVVMYHRFGESSLPLTNIHVEQFEAHLDELADSRYSVLPISEILSKLSAREPLPDRAVGISIDDAFLSVYEEAWPRLRDAGMPFTLFVATKALDEGVSGYMTWDQLRELHAAGVSIGSQTHSHPHMPRGSKTQNLEELRVSNERFRAELGAIPDIIAYPYGEYSLAVRDAAKEAGFAFGFGQHSGAIHYLQDMYYLPRFSMNEAYGGLSRFKLAVNALPLPVKDVTPADPLLSDETNPPPFGFTVAEPVARRLSRLSCYEARQGKLKLELLGPRVEVRLGEALAKGRSRVNCTMPARSGRWRWFGMQFYLP